MTLALVPALTAVVLLVMEPALSTVALAPAVMPKALPKIVPEIVLVTLAAVPALMAVVAPECFRN